MHSIKARKIKPVFIENKPSTKMKRSHKFLSGVDTLLLQQIMESEGGYY